jgi:hypothetical protein
MVRVIMMTGVTLEELLCALVHSSRAAEEHSLRPVKTLTKRSTQQANKLCYIIHLSQDKFMNQTTGYELLIPPQVRNQLRCGRTL